MLFLGIYSTMMLNVSDYSRELHKDVKPGLLTTIYAMSILPATLFMGLIGLMVWCNGCGRSGSKVFSSAVDNTPLLVITLLFIAFAQVTTNVLNNVVPPAYVLMDVSAIVSQVGGSGWAVGLRHLPMGAGQKTNQPLDCRYSYRLIPLSLVRFSRCWSWITTSCAVAPWTWQNIMMNKDPMRE